MTDSSIIHGVDRDQAIRRLWTTPSREGYEVTCPGLVEGLTDRQLIDIAADGPERHFGGSVDRADGHITIIVSTD